MAWWARLATLLLLSKCEDGTETGTTLDLDFNNLRKSNYHIFICLKTTLPSVRENIEQIADKSRVRWKRTRTGRASQRFVFFVSSKLAL